jgi:hypothetical protein
MLRTFMIIMSRTLATAAVAIVFAGTSWAGNVEARFGNTVVAKSSDGSVTKVWYNKDKSLIAKVEAPGKPAVDSKGTWRVDGDKVCLTYDTAFGAFEANKERCVPLSGDKVGDSWKLKSKDAAGKDVDLEVTIVSGR